MSPYRQYGPNNHAGTPGIARTGIPNVIIDLEKQMHNAAGSPDFGKAIALRDRIKKLNERLAGK